MGWMVDLENVERELAGGANQPCRFQRLTKPCMDEIDVERFSVLIGPSIVRRNKTHGDGADSTRVGLSG